jgi:hypothetical protein
LPDALSPQQKIAKWRSRCRIEFRFVEEALRRKPQRRRASEPNSALVNPEATTSDNQASRLLSYFNFQMVTFRPDGYVTEISNERTMSQMIGRHCGQNRHNLHAGAHSGLNARTCIFEYQALLGWHFQ